MPGPRKWRHRAAGHCGRWTVPREAIVQLLSKSSNHLSAKEIYTALIRQYPGIGMTTIYRTLDLLTRMGLIHRFAIGDGHMRYEFTPDMKKEHHHHLICTQCGKIINYSEFVEEELALVQKIEEKLIRKYSFKITDHNIEFLGRCPDCRESRRLSEP